MVICLKTKKFRMKSMKHKVPFILCTIVFIILTTSLFCHAITETKSTSELNAYEDSEEYSEQVLKQENEELKQNLALSLLVEFVGAFLGVLTALALNKYSENKSIANLEKELLDELSSIRKELEERINQEKDFIFYRYSTPIWDINLAAGNLSLFINRTEYKSYIKVYAKIQYAQSLENEYANIMQLSDDKSEESFDEYKSTIEFGRKREAQNILNMIIELKKDVK